MHSMSRLLFITLASSLLVFCAGVVPARAELRTQGVEYVQGETTLEGYMAYDDQFKGRRPGVLVVHEWTGLGDYVKGRCDKLAKLGYVAFGADIYGKGVRLTTHEEAARVSGIYTADRALLRARVKAGLERLLANELTDPARVAAIGYCFGGAAVLELARSGADISGVVTFHGVLSNPNPADAKNIKAALLLQHGADDPFVDKAQLDAFMDEMKNTRADWRIIMYGGVVHSFTVPAAGDDPSAGAAYDEKADMRSWRAMLDFFDEIFE